MNNVKITIIAAIDQDLLQEKKNKGFSEKNILRHIRESIDVDYPKLRAACIYDYQVESVEAIGNHVQCQFFNDDGKLRFERTVEVKDAQIDNSGFYHHGYIVLEDVQETYVAYGKPPFIFKATKPTPIERAKCPSCGTVALVRKFNGTQKCLACENEVKEG